MTPTGETVARLMNKTRAYRTEIYEETGQAMLQAGLVRHYPKGSFVTRRGQKTPMFCLILEGSVRLTAFSEDGREMLTAYLYGGESWGVHPCLGGYDETNDSVVGDEALLLMLTPKAMQDLIWSQRDFQAAMIGLLCTRLNLTVRIAEQNGSWSARERLAWRLHLMCRADAGDPSLFDPEIKLSQENLASMVHLSRQRTNTLLKDFEREGALSLKYGKIWVLDPDVLRLAYQRTE